MSVLNRNKITILHLFRYFSSGAFRYFPIAPLSTLLLCISVISTNPAQAQNKEYYFKTLTTNDGLLGNVNAFIYKDSNGFLWLSSMLGLNRFDGQVVKTYKHDDKDPHALLNSNIQSEFIEDVNRDIWFCTDVCINVYRRKHDRFDRYHIKDKKGQIVKSNYYIFHLDTEGYLWFRLGTPGNGDLYKWHISGTKEAIYLHPFSGLRAIANVDTQGHVSSILSYTWGTSMGLSEYVYDKNHNLIAHKPYFSGQPTDAFTSRDTFRVYKIFKEKGSNIFWLATKTGLVKWDKSQSTFKVFDKIGNTKIEFLTDIAQYKNQLWIGAKENRGVFIFDLTTENWVQNIKKKKEFREGELPYANINSLYIDSDGNVWLSDWTKGVAYTNLEKNKFPLIHIPSPINALNAYSIIADEKNNIWIADKGKNIIVLNQQREIIHQFNGAFFGNTNLKFYLDKKNRFWVYTIKGELFLYNKVLNRFSKIPFSEKTPDKLCINSCYQLNDGRLVLATSHGLYEVYDFKKSFVVKKNQFLRAELQNESFTQIFENSQHQVFLNQDGKHLWIYQFDTNKATFEIVIPLNTDKLEVLELQNNDYYLATKNGLLHLQKHNDGSFILKDTTFSGETIYGILKDKKNNFWLSSERGILKYTPSTKQIKNYSLVDGLQSLSFGINATIEDNFGQFWMGGSNGINVFNPLNIKNYAIPPKLQITGIKVNNTDLKVGLSASEIEHLTVPYDSNNIQIDFISIDFSDSQRDSIRYSFSFADDKNPNWVTGLNTKPSLSLFNLNEGTYIFRFRAANSDGIWLEGEKKLLITVLPPFYRTTWFYIICFLLAGLGIWLFFKQREKRIRTTAAFEQKIAETQMSALRSQMDPHFIYNSLNSINAYVMQNVPLQASLYLTEFSLLMRKILNYSIKNRISLEKEEEILRGYMTMEALRSDFDFDVEISGDLDSWQTMIPTMILQPFVENAIKHGISAKQDGRGEILVKFKKDGEFLVCIVEDNGVGLTKSAQINETQRDKSHVSKGMQITRDRLIIITKQTGKEATFSISPRSEEDGGGTKVIVRVPL